ncbi:transposase [Clostridium sp. 'deep sea']|nr:transposase [Clostridium sp. 'deep sea']
MFNLVVLNPLSTNLYRKAQTLRKTKTDKIDAKMIAKTLKTTSPTPQYHTI